MTQRSDMLGRWAASGMLSLSGDGDRVLGPPTTLMAAVDRWSRYFDGIDVLELLGERAALAGLHRRGSISCGGSSRVLATADGWLAVSLPRPDDLLVVPAWLECHPLPSDPDAAWSVVAGQVHVRPTQHLVGRAALFGIPTASVGEVAPTDRPGVVHRRLGWDPPSSPAGLLVVDLSTMWAGPLCGGLLVLLGARVIKVESSGRSDGARHGSPAFFDLLNGEKQSVVLDVRVPEGRRQLSALLRQADVVIESARPRALRQLGIEAAELVSAGRPRIWVSITGYGREGEAGNRVAFGDDAAAAGGLVGWNGGRPVFCGDAIADPLSGIAAATAAVEALGCGGRWLLDVSMASVAAALSGPMSLLPADTAATAPRARRHHATAPPMGADTEAVLGDLHLPR